MNWKKGRGRLGIFQPLLGVWTATAESAKGPVVCLRSFSSALSGKYIELQVQWKFASSSYEERALVGVDSEKTVRFWSFTSDGKQSQGVLADVSDLDKKAFGFEAQMPAGLARQAYWPHEDEGYVWVVESKTKKGWNRFVEHHYTVD